MVHVQIGHQNDLLFLRIPCIAKYWSLEIPSGAASAALARLLVCAIFPSMSYCLFYFERDRVMDQSVTASLAAAVENQDYVSESVPLSARRGPLMLSLLWITMVTGFPTVLAGFDWFREGLTLHQVLWCCVASIVILMGYSIPACMLGSRSGQTYALLSRQSFGRVGSLIVSLNLGWISILWYGLTAMFLANGLQGIYHFPIGTEWLAVLLASVMSFNNLFGFAGVANFAGYIAAPVLIVWIAFAFFKASFACPPIVFHQQSHVGMARALTLVSTFVIGYASWGNEPDYWRYAKPGASLVVIPLAVSLVLGNLIFPVTGWLMAYLFGVTSYSAATELMTKFAFGGFSLVAAVVLFVTYCAQNDANMYAAINGISNVRSIPRKYLTLCLTIACALCAFFLTSSKNSIETVASMSSTVLPCPTVVMIAEWFVIGPMRKMSVDFSIIPELATLPPVKWAALISIAIGSVVGIATAGIVPGWERWHVGVCSLQAWLATFAVYLVCRPIELKLENQSCCGADQGVAELGQ